MAFIYDALQVIIHLSQRERKFFVLKNAILKNWKISEGTSRREKCSMCFSAQRTPTKSFALFILDLFVFVIYFVDFGLYFFFLFTFSAYKKKEKVPKRKKNQLVFQNSSSSLWFFEPLFAKQTFASLWLVCAYSA